MEISWNEELMRAKEYKFFHSDVGYILVSNVVLNYENISQKQP